MAAVKAKVPPPVTTTSPEETPSVMGEEMVVVVPGATLKTGSPETVMALAIVVVAVVVKVAGTVALPIKAKALEPKALASGIVNEAPDWTCIVPVKPVLLLERV